MRRLPGRGRRCVMPAWMAEFDGALVDTTNGRASAYKPQEAEAAGARRMERRLPLPAHPGNGG
jgi:hypothetical protein